MRLGWLLAVAVILAGCGPKTFEEGYSAQLDKKYQEAISIYTPLADGGDVRAQIELANVYSAKGEFKDEKLEYKYIKLAADQDQAYAQYRLGFLYQQGKGVEKKLGLCRAAIH